MQRMSLSCSVLLAAVVCAGCGAAGNIPKAAVSGVVTLDGKPLAGVSVNFNNEALGFSGYGKTDSEGRYSLVQGAAVGTNTVVLKKITEMEGFDEDPESGMDDGQLEAMQDGGENGESIVSNKIPEEYGEKSKLKYEVTASGATDANFDLVTPTPK